MIHLKEDDDQRTVVTARNRNSCRRSVSDVCIYSYNKKGFFHQISIFSEFSEQSIEDEEKEADSVKETCEQDTETETKSVPTSPDHLKSLTLPMKLDVKTMEWDELDELLQVIHKLFVAQMFFFK